MATTGLGHLKDALLDLLFPPRCIGCQRGGTWLCASCRAQIELVLPPLCAVCGQHLDPGSACRNTHPRSLDGIRSAAYSTGVLREGIHQFKYEGLRVLAVPFGELLCACWQAHPWPADGIVPVPLHPRRVRERGYNQSLLLAEQLARGTGLTLEAKLLQRTRYTRPQVGLNAPERAQNVADAFACVAPVTGRRLVLVDDVCTTGATLDACGAALKAQGAASVWALTLARARDLN